MDIEIKIDGIKELEKNLNKVYESMIKGANKGMRDVSENIQSVAKSIAPTDGRNLLKNAIMTMESSGNPFNVYDIYVDIVACPFAYYVYFGTGIYGKGKKLYVWFVGESSLKNSTPDLMDTYNYRSFINDKTGEIVWEVHGQKPKRFLEEAVETTSNQNRDIISKAIRNEIRKGM